MCVYTCVNDVYAYVCTLVHIYAYMQKWFGDEKLHHLSWNIIFSISNILISAYFVGHSVEKEDIIHNVDG